MELRSVPDRDPSADAQLVPAGDDVIIEITLQDGRSTLRRITRAEALAPTLRALLTLPPAPAPEVVLDAGVPPLASDASLPVDAAPPVPAPPVAAAPVALDFGVEVIVDVAARVSAAYVSAAYRLGVQLRTSAWLFGLAVRWEPFQWYTGAGPDAFEMDSFGAGVYAGRRWSLGIASLGTGLAVNLMQEGQGFQVGSVEFNGTTTSARIGTFGRLVVGHGSLRFVTQLDAEIVPARLRRGEQLNPGAPFLPVWSASLGLGILWIPQ